MREQNLDGKLENPNWKQWLPVYGILQVIEDGKRGEPIIIARSEACFHGTAIYQAVSIVALGIGTGIGAFSLASYLL